MFSSDLSKEITSNIEISFVKVSSYVGTESTGTVDELIGLNSTLKNKHVEMEDKRGGPRGRGFSRGGGTYVQKGTQGDQY